MFLKRQTQFSIVKALTKDFFFKTNKVLVVQTFVNSLDERTTTGPGRGFKAISSKNVCSALRKQTCDGQK